MWRERLRRIDGDPRAIRLIKAARARLPGDPAFGDPLSTGGPRAWQLFGRRLAEVTGRRPGLLSEAGLGALQVWEHVAEAQGRGRGTTELAIVFTDLVDFSAWALDAGDDAALALLREVGGSAATTSASTSTSQRDWPRRRRRARSSSRGRSRSGSRRSR